MRWFSELLSWVFAGRHSSRPVETTSFPARHEAPLEVRERELARLGADLGVAETRVRPAREVAVHSPLWHVKNTDRRRKLWCGPTVVSAIIGIDAAVARDIIKAHRGGRAVMGTTARELDLVFRAHGCRLELVADFSGDAPTLAGWFRLPRDPLDALVVEVTGHWVAVRGDWFCDTMTEGRPVRLRHAPRKRMRVRRVYRVSMLQ